MKLATFLDHSGSERVGAVRQDRIHPFVDGLTMRDLIDLGLDAVRELETSRGLPLADVRLLPPLLPASIRDFVAFEEHVEGVRRSIDGAGGVPEAWYDAPTFYFTNPHTIVGPDVAVPFPAASAECDFELEVAAVVGRRGRSLTAEDGADAVFGYTILNDWSARDLQRREMQVGLGPAKGKDFATTLGPWIVTADELQSFVDDDGFLRLTCAVAINGVEIGRDLLSNMGWGFGTLVAYASRDSWVVPGDVLGSGTTGNGGCLAELWGRHGRKDPPPLRNGDVVTLTVEGIGSVSNVVAAAVPAPDLPAFRPRPARVMS
jgi:2-keto-4-pentenoate hydratase/2-oxohepta-3-ene-1,7-dioic acid hydratase in catechol pathway